MTTVSLPHPDTDAAIVTTALRRAADHLGLSQGVLARCLMTSESTVSRAWRGRGGLFGSGPAAAGRMQLALLLIRIYRSLHGLFGDDAELHRQWLGSANSALGAAPIDLITTPQGLVHVLDYLDGMRGP